MVVATTNLFARLTIVFRDVFDDDEIALTPHLAARDVEGWDSIGTVRLFLEIERTFRVRFSAAEISLVKNVGEIVDLLGRKLPPRLSDSLPAPD